MEKVVAIKFYKSGIPNGKVYYFKVNGLKIKNDLDVVVDTDRGEEIVRAVTDIVEVDEKKYNFELKNVERIATKKDLENKKRNEKERFTIFTESKEFIESRLPQMQIISAEYTLNRDLLLISFVSESRVDFRELVRELAAKYRTRIELRQVGVRDEAKIIGGIGMCGRIICCNSFATEFAAVSINMAKNQGLSLVPSKISGLCGRLLCCLRYEDEDYKEMKKGLPKVGSKYETSQGKGKVISLNVLLRTMKVYVEGKGIVEVELDGSSK
ncbi:MAG: stage 0 sporulation family protein [Bacilli bacterium]